MAMTCSTFRYSNADHTWVTCTEHGDQIPVAPGNRHWDSIVERGCEILPYLSPEALEARRAMPYDAMVDGANVLPSLPEITEAYESSHDLTDMELPHEAVDAEPGEVGADIVADADPGGDAGEPAEASEDADPDGSADFSAEPVGDDSGAGGANSYPGMMMVGDPLAAAKAMALMAVDDERFARVGDYDKAANQAKLDELRAIQQAIREGVHPPFTAEQASELQALETFLPFMQRIDDHAQALRNAIRDAADLEALTAIDLLHGWPE